MCVHACIEQGTEGGVYVCRGGDAGVFTAAHVNLCRTVNTLISLCAGTFTHTTEKIKKLNSHLFCSAI